MKKWIIVIVVVLVFVCAVLYRVYRIKSITPAESIDSIAMRSGLPVRVFEVARRDLSESIAISGEIEAYEQVTVAPVVVDRIEAIHVKTGQRVTKGQRLITLETAMSELGVRHARASLRQVEEMLRKLRNGTRDEDKAAAKAALDKADAQCEICRIEANRQKQLYAEQATALKMLQDAENAEKVANACLLGAQAAYDKAVNGSRIEDIAIAQAQVEIARVSLEQKEEILCDHYLDSPCDGIVTDCPFEVGDVAEVNTVLLKVLRVDRVYLVIDVSELYIASIDIGMSVDVTVDAIDERVFRGVVEEVNPIANEADRSFTTKIVIDNADGSLMSGMFGRGHIVVRQIDNALVLPADALRESDGVTYVLIVSEDNVAKRVDIECGMGFGDMVEVVSGVSEGDRVVTLCQGIVKDGMKVSEK